MLAYTARRLIQSVFVVLLLTLLTFALLHALPGGPVKAILGRRASPLATRQFIHANGFDKPLIVQYLDYLGHLLHGNLGFSYVRNQSVDSLLSNELPKSIVLVGISLILTLIIGIGTGVWQAMRVNRWDDHVITGTSFFIYAMPDFFLAEVLVDLFAIRLHIFPPFAPQGPTWTSAFTNFNAMILPEITLTLLSFAGFSRYVRSSALDVFGQDFIRVARAKGSTTGRIIWGHTLRNGAGPVITLLGLSLPGLFGGAFIIENVFNYPGIGLETIQATYQRDYPVILATTVLFGFLTILGNLLADLAYARADPRVRLQ